MDQIYAMGFDVWAEGLSLEEYLVICRNSPKYRKGKWFVLSQAKNLLSSLVVYQFDGHTMGIGSVATPQKIRKNGYASQLIKSTVNYLREANPDILIFLYSDISTNFYEKLGFTRLEDEVQRYSISICMAMGSFGNSKLNNKLQTPEYF